MYTRETQQYSEEYDAGLSYKGLPIYSTLGVHEEVYAEVEKVIGKEQSVLVIGSGSGAFEQRMMDGGFKNITPSDFHDSNFRVNNLRDSFVHLDFNTRFGKNVELEEKFDAVVLIDVIEHTHNIRQFIEECYHTLKIGGRVFIATPNIHSHESIGNSMLFGGPISFEGKPKEFEHFSVPSLGIIESSARLSGYSDVSYSGIVNKHFDVPESVSIKILRRVAVAVARLTDGLGKMASKIDGTIISDFYSDSEMQKVKEGIYLLVTLQK